MGYGEALGYNYQIGRDQLAQPAQMAQQSVESDPELGQYDKNDLLANRGKLTQDVYNNMGILRNYAQELAKKGIDVTKPDFTQEGGGPEHMTYLMLDASVKHAANALKNEYQAEQQLRPREADGKIRFNQGVDRSGNYMQNPENYYSTEPLENVKEANIRGRENTYTQGDQNRINARIAEESAQIDQQVASGRLSKEQGELQKSYLVNNAHTTPASGFSEKKGNGKYDYQLGLLRKYTNLSQGVWNPGTYTKKVIGGKAYLINEDGKGDVLGKYEAGVNKDGTPITKDKVVKWWRMDPETHQVQIEYTDSSIPPELVSNRSGDAVTRDFVGNNSKYGSVDKFMEAAQANGVLDETGSVINPTIMPADADQMRKDVANEGLQTNEAINKQRKSHEKQLIEIKDPLIGNNRIEFNLPGDKKIEIGKHRGKDLFYIENPKEFVDVLEGKPVKELTKKEVIDYLSQLGRYDELLKGEPISIEYTPIQTKALAAFVKQLGREPNESEKAKILSKYK